MPPQPCDTIHFQVLVTSEDLSDITYISFVYSRHEEIVRPTIPEGFPSYSIHVDYDIPLGDTSVYYRAYVRDDEGFSDTDTGYALVDSGSNSLQDTGEGGVDCGGASHSVCRDCLGDFSYPGYDLGIDETFRMHFNFPNDDELELAQSLAGDALEEYSAHSGIWLYNLDTSDEYMEAVAYYVDRHMNYMNDTDPSLGWDGGQTFWRTVTESGARGCGNDFCGDCDDFAILRMTLLLSIGVSDDCVFIIEAPGHLYNNVYYGGKFRIMDYGELGRYFKSPRFEDLHDAHAVARASTDD